MAVPTNMNHCWSIDFNREALAIEVDLNIPAHRVVRVLERLSTERGYPAFIRSDNGPEFIAAALSG